MKGYKLEHKGSENKVGRDIRKMQQVDATADD